MRISLQRPPPYSFARLLQLVKTHRVLFPSYTRGHCASRSQPIQSEGENCHLHSSIPIKTLPPPNASKAPSPETTTPTDEDFDLQRGVVLAGCSFEAYADVVSSQGIEQRSTSGVRVVYTSNAFLEEYMDGLLEITDVEASSSADSRGVMDTTPASRPLRWKVSLGEDSCVEVPFVQQHDDSSAYETKGNTPSQNLQARLLFARDLARQRLIVRLVDSKDTIVGLVLDKLATSGMGAATRIFMSRSLGRAMLLRRTTMLMERYHNPQLPSICASASSRFLRYWLRMRPALPMHHRRIYSARLGQH